MIKFRIPEVLTPEEQEKFLKNLQLKSKNQIEELCNV